MHTSTRCGARSRCSGTFLRSRCHPPRRAISSRPSAAGVAERRVRAYAFTDPDRRSYVTDAAWPPAGQWLQPGDSVRACSAGDLAWWLDAQLWEVELEGDVTQVGRALTAPRARLVRLVDAWSEAIATELVAVCARRVRDQAVRALHEAGRAKDASVLEQAETPEEIEAAAAPVGNGDDAAGKL